MGNAKKIVITGTHQSPALEFFRALKNDTSYKWETYYLGRKFRSSESNVVATEYELFQKLNVKYFIVDSGKFDRNSLLKSIQGIPAIFTGFANSLRILKQIQPDIIVSFGGYNSVPVLYAGRLLGIKSIIHEQTLTVSLTTRLATPIVNKIALSFDNPDQKQSLPKKKTVVTGNLIRQDLFLPAKKNLLLGRFKEKKPLIYITGGNQGSVSINRIILSILPALTSKYNIIHQVGKFDYAQIAVATKKQKNYQCYEYIETKEVVPIYQNAQVVISRSGANISQELVALSKKAILIPLPNTQQQEQTKNALWAKQIMGHNIEIIDEPNLTGDLILNTLASLLKLPESKHQNPSANGSANFLKLVHSLI